METEHPLRMAKSFREFEKTVPENKEEDYRVVCREVSGLTLPKKTQIYEESRFFINRLEDGTYYRVFKRTAGKKEPYAVSRYHLENKTIYIEYLAAEREQFETVQQAFSHIAWEWILMREKKLMLHASCVETTFGGLLFSGPSGMGKSTQGDLWCRYGEGRLINGDKTILSREQGNWFGHGSPYAGSSKCYVDDRCRLKGLFFLKQGKNCSLKPLGVAESFKRIYTGLTVNRWDSAYVEKASQLAQQLAIELPVYEFTCTPDENAVHFLRQKLQEGDMINGRTDE